MEVKNIKCEKCGNHDRRYFYHGSNGWYCRKCIKYQCDEEIEKEINLVDSQYVLKFELSTRQKEISEKLCQLINQNKSVLLEAVTGAGKTELVYQTIADQLSKNRKVGFAISRRQVVLEIASRMQKDFPNLKVVPVCQGHTTVVTGDLIVCTTHQLYRYHNYFDLLIIDEPDGFPYKNDLVLQGIAKRSCCGNMVYLTATPDQYLTKMVSRKRLAYLYLSKRPTGKPLIVPKVIYCLNFVLDILLIYYIVKLLKTKRPLIVFAPSIKISRLLYFVLKPFISCCQIDSKRENKDEILNDFRNGKYKLIVATTVLERGITIERVNVIVYKADSQVFDDASLIQISGRVGRGSKYTDGQCIFLSSSRNENIDSCLERIIRANND